MALQEYTVVINGVEHTLQLSEEDAKKYPDAKAKQAAAPANKARTADTK